jgi:hypothetical protein
MSGFAPSVEQRLYWFRLSSLLLESVTKVFRGVIVHFLPLACQRLNVSVDASLEYRLCQLWRNSTAPDNVVLNAWRTNDVQQFDFSASCNTILSTELYEGVRSLKSFKIAVRSLSAQRNEVAAHPTACKVKNEAEFKALWDAITERVRELCGYLPKNIGPDLQRKFNKDAKELENLKVSDAEVEARVLTMQAMVSAVQASVSVLGNRVDKIEDRGTEFKAWLDHHSGDASDGALLSQAFDDLCGFPHFFQFKRADADGQLKRYSASPAAKKNGVTLFAVRASYSGEHLFSIVYATAGVVCDKPYAVSFDREQKVFTVAGKSSTDVLVVIDDLMRECKFEAIDTSMPDGFYWHESDEPAAPAPADTDRVAQLEERVRRLEDIIRKHFPTEL